MFELKNTIDEVNGRLDTVDENISEPESKEMETYLIWRRKILFKKKSISEPWDNFKQPKIRVFGAPPPKKRVEAEIFLNNDNLQK